MTDHDLLPLDITYSNEQVKAAWDILNRAQEETHALSIARAAANYGEYLSPETPGEYLYWIKDQAAVQQDGGDQESDLRAALHAYRFACALWRIALALDKLGIEEEAPTRRKGGKRDGQ